jgi:hypothetical protein
MTTLESVAKSLAGETVTIRRRWPCIKGAAGIAFRDQAGRAIVDIDPTAEGGELLRILAHESAHVKHGHASRGPWADYPSQSVTIPQLDAIHAKVENEADQTAAKWLQYSADHWREYPGSTEFNRRLAALEAAPLNLLVDKAIERGVAAALRDYR